MTCAPFFCDLRLGPDGARTLVLCGELDEGTAPLARRAIAAAAGSRGGPLRIDLAWVLVTDVFGVAVLLKARHVHRAELVNVSPANEAILRRMATGDARESAADAPPTE